MWIKNEVDEINTSFINIKNITIICLNNFTKMSNSRNITTITNFTDSNNNVSFKKRL